MEREVSKFVGTLFPPHPYPFPSLNGLRELAYTLKVSFSSRLYIDHLHSQHLLTKKHDIHDDELLPSSFWVQVRVRRSANFFHVESAVAVRRLPAHMHPVHSF